MFDEKFDEKMILAGWMIDGTGEPIKKSVLLGIKNGIFDKIQLLPVGSMKPPGILDLSEYTLLPCLGDAHAHLFMSGTGNQSRRKRQLNEDFNQVKKSISKHLEQLLAHGVLAVRDGGDKDGYTRQYKKNCMKAKYAGISLHVAGKAWHKPGRYGSFVGCALKEGSLAEGILRRSDDIDHVKIIQSGLNSLTVFGKESPPQFHLKALREAVGVSTRLGLKTMVHANGKVPVQIALEAGCSSIEHGFFMGKENLAQMAHRKVFWVPTAYTMKAYAEHAEGSKVDRRVALRNLEHQLEQISEAKRLGVPIALGTDSGSIGVHHGSAVIHELRLLLDAGFSVEGAIKCASLNIARLLGLDGKGFIAKGKRADFVAVKGSPWGLPESLRDISLLHVGEGS